MAAPRQTLIPAARTAQTAVMTPALQQAIRLLQLTNLELADAVAEALESNPMLREVDAEETDPPATDLAPSTAQTLAQPLAQPAADGVVRLGQGAAVPYAQALWQGRPWRGRGAGESAGLDAAQTLAGLPTLQEHAATQAAMLCSAPEERAIAAHLIGELDAWGWCTVDPAQVAAALGVAAESVNAVLTTLRTMEPVGLFAGSLAQCLALQLEDRGEMTPVLRTLLDNLDLLGSGDLPGLAAACGVGIADLDPLIAKLRGLNPHPGAAFAETPVETRVPDLLLRPAPGGGWTLEINPETLPQAMVDRAYAAELRAGRLTSDERRFIREQVQAASWLVRAIEQRATTLLTVAAEALRRQEASLTDPSVPRRPLTMGDVGEALEMHVSTISRAVAGKHVATPTGLLALRDCFVGGVATADGGMSAGEIQMRLQALVAAETAPLSDAALAAALSEGGIPVARRTVAKYRGALGIPASPQRRRRTAKS